MPRLSFRPDSRARALENAAFLDALRQTGNTKAAAAAIGRTPVTMRDRRKRDPAFATEWRAAEIVAAARLQAQLKNLPRNAWEEASRGAYRTKGNEQVIIRGRGGRLIQRAAAPNRLTRVCEQAFLLALSTTANVTLSAAAAGSPRQQFYRRRRLDEGFAREWREAMAQGYAMLELRCMAAADPESHQHDAWRHNKPPEPPPMTTNQMLQLLYLHQKEVRLKAEPAHLRKRRGESHEAHGVRLRAIHEAELERAREQCRIAEAVREARGEPTRFVWEQITLPDLAQVQAGRADPAKAPHDPGRALFGGWRIKELRQAQAAPPEPPTEVRRGRPKR